MDKISMDLRDLDNIDIRNGQAMTNVTSHNAVSGIEKAALKSSLNFSSSMFPDTGFLREPVNIAEHEPTVAIIPPSKVLLGLGHFLVTRPITAGIGPSASMAAGIGITIQGGVYGSTTPEVGVFVTGGLGLWTNAGVGVGGTLTVVLGPPADFFGDFWAVGVDVSPVPGKLISVGGQLLFAGSFPSLPVRFMGFAVGVAFGPSISPIDLTVQSTTTFGRPLLKFK
jgi:hypothetical protein